MGKPLYNKLEKLGRVRLSPNFFMREFLHSEISQAENTPNVPHYPEIAIEVGKKLCSEVLEPIQASLGKIAIRSAYRSPEINAIGASNKNQYNCSSNERTHASHIWDYPDKNGHRGATTCIVVCSYVDYYEETGDWQSLANWIHINVPAYSAMYFFPKLCAFNISWHENPKHSIKSYIAPRGKYTPTGIIKKNAPLMQ